MKFTEALAHFCVALREPYGEFTELWRALREGSAKLEAEERKLARKAAAEGHPIDWGESGFRDLLRGKTGPGGGLEATPIRLSFFFSGYLLDCQRPEVAEQALAMTYATVRGQAVCPKTKERHFGPAFTRVLADPSLLARCADIGVSSDLGMAYLDFVPPGEEAGPWTFSYDCTRSWFCTPAHESAPKGRYSVLHLYPFTLRPVMALIQGSDARPARAARKSKKAKVMA